MKNKLIITRITSYGLSSGLTIPLLIIEFNFPLLVFNIVMYFTIYHLTDKYNNNKIGFLSIITESLTITFLSYSFGLAVSHLLILNISNFIILLIYGNIANIVIGSFLGIINYMVLNFKSIKLWKQV